MRLKRLAAAFSILASLSAVSWGAQEFKIDPAWSHVEFSVSNFGLNTVYGRFQTFSGAVSYDETDVTRSSATVVIQIASIDTGSKKRDAHLQTADFFAASQFPVMTFQSARVEKKGDGYVLVGPLTIKGHTKEVSLRFTYSIEKPSEGLPILRAEAHGDIDRHDFDINYGSNFSVGRVVHIQIHIQAVP